MNAQLQLFFMNIDKISLYFGSDAKYFYLDLALKLTVRNQIFHYEEYEAVRRHIKNNTKWYQSARTNPQIVNTYYLQYAKQPEQLGSVFAFYKTLTRQLPRGEQSYIAAAYLKSQEDIPRIHSLMAELAKQPGMKYTAPKPAPCAMLAARPESSAALAETIEQYYQALMSIGYTRSGHTKNAALVLTLGTGIYSAPTFTRLDKLASFLKKSDGKLKPHHYTATALLALAKFEVHQFPALYDIHDEICRFLKLSDSSCNSLLIATQIYTSNEAIGDLPAYAPDFADIIFSAIESTNSGAADSESGSIGQ